MSKRLPYFQFEPGEWLAGDIMFCSFAAQGLFATLKAIYWQKDCILSLEQAIRRLGNKELFEELIKEKIIKINEGKIKINYLDNQYVKAVGKSIINSKNGKLGGRPKKRTESEKKANGLIFNNRNESESKPINIKENKIIENNSNIKEEISFRKLKFSDSLKPFLEKYGKEFLNEFYKYWTEPNKSGTKFRQEAEKFWDLEKRLNTWNQRKKGDFKNTKKDEANFTINR